MVAEFTLVYERQANGKYTAYVAEFPDFRSVCRTLEEVRAALTEELCRYFEGERMRSLMKAGPDAQVEPLRIDTTVSLPPASETQGERPDIVPTLGKRVRIDPKPRKE